MGRQRRLEMKGKKVPNHLGGHAFVTHLDEGALRFLIGQLEVKTMWDLGCGPGGMVKLARDLGVRADGIDGDFSQGPGVVHDFCEGPLEVSGRDLCWSVEFVEHVEEEFIPNFVAVMQVCRWVCMTFAPRGATGHHHVNCRDSYYWVAQLRGYGLDFEPQLTAELRRASTMSRDFIRETGMIFRNREN